jgi:ankyrin repeat protein
VKKLIEKDPQLVNAKSPQSREPEGWTPLICATGNKHFAIVKYLVTKGANVNGVDGSGNRPLNTAVMGGRWQIIKYLVSKGADVNGTDGRGGTPLHAAITHQMPKDHLAIVKYLVSQGANLHDRSPYGETLLHFTTDPQVAQWLINQSVNVNARDKLYGFTPLQKCVVGRLKAARSSSETKNIVRVIQVLIYNGADVNVKDQAGKTLLHRAKQITAPAQRQQVVKLLLQAGARG